MMMGRIVLAGAAICALAPAGCNKDYTVKRVDPTESTEVDYRFNDEDARQVLHEMASDCLAQGWVDKWMREHNGKAPIVYLATIRNNTQDYVNTQLFTTEFQAILINSGRVEVKAEKEWRQEIRDERLDTQYNDPATLKQIAKELNADFAIIGNVNDSKQRTDSGNKVVSYYKVDMQAVDVETAQKVWIGNKDVKKVATR